ncbi:MAG: LysR family transcriptional regulator [Halanaerobiales bacterium]|nr:LysR family transcriptional regulator [Halanaerobiales bacterium]
MTIIKLKYKLWLADEEKLFGDGPCAILQLVQRLGSLRQAAEELKMSYSQAWKLIKSLEARWGFKLIESKSGGIAGGGSTLTRQGRYLIKTYRSFRQEAVVELERLENKWFSQQFRDSLYE